MIFESYEAMSAYGTWFSGVLTAVAVFSSVIIASSSAKKRIKITVDVYREGFTIRIHNESKDPFLLQNLGVYLCGRSFDLVEIDDCFMKPGESNIYCIDKDRWSELRKLLSNHINHNLNNSFYMQILRWFKREEMIVDGNELQRKMKFQYVVFRISVQSSDALYITKKWLSLSMFDSSEQRRFHGPYHCYDTRKNIIFNSTGLSLSILILILILCSCIYYEGNQFTMILYVILVIILYFTVSFESSQKIHPAAYYTAWCVIIGLCINALMLLSLEMSITLFIFAEVLLWILISCGVLPRMMMTAGLIGY